MDFLKAGLPWNRRSSVLVERSEVASKLELFMDAQFLVTEDCTKYICQFSAAPNRDITDDLQTTPRSATSNALKTIHPTCVSSADPSQSRGGTHSSSFWVFDSCRRSMPSSSVPMTGVMCVTVDAADNRLFFSGSAESALSVTANSFRGSHLTSGQKGCTERIAG